MKTLFLYSRPQTAVVVWNSHQVITYHSYGVSFQQPGEKSRTAVERWYEPTYQEKIVVITLIHYASNVSPPATFYHCQKYSMCFI